MKCYMIALFFLSNVGTVLCRALPGDEKTHPVTGVIELLESLLLKVEQQRQAEEITYTRYSYWCTTSLKTLNGAIADETAALDSEESRIESLTGQEAQLKEQIQELADELLVLAAGEKKAKNVRIGEANLFKNADADYDSTIKAIGDAITNLESAYTQEEANEATALVQSAEKAMSSATKAKVLQALTLGSSAASATDAERNEIASLVDLLVRTDSANPAPPAGPTSVTRPNLTAEGDYAKHIDKYNFRSHKVIELLKGLLTKFQDEKLAATKAETNSLNARALSKQARDEEVLQAGNSKSTRETELGDVQGDLSESQGKVTNLRNDLKADQALQTTTSKSCDIKKSEYAERQATREGEKEAMTQAIKILAEVTGVGVEPPSNPVPPPSPVDATSLLQVADPKARAVQLLRESAKQTHSKALARLAQEIATHLTGPFDKVNNMIEKMIFRLMQEQKDEDVHKNWCDLELNKTDTSIADKSDKMAELKAKIDKAVARMAELLVEINDDTAMVATVTAHMAESEEIRSAGKEENAIAVKEAKQAQTAIANAIAVLDSFYKDSGMVAKEPWEFIQAPTDLSAEPSTWTKSYSGLADPTKQPKGVIAVLKSVASKFSQMEANTNAQEETDQHFYEQDMKESKIEVARRMKEAEMKTEERKRLVDKKLSLDEQHKHVSDQKAATDQYLADLQHACVDGDSTYADREAARSNEIAALKQAQIILRDAFKAPAGPVATPAPPAVPTFLQRRNH